VDSENKEVFAKVLSCKKLKLLKSDYRGYAQQSRSLLGSITKKKGGGEQKLVIKSSN